MPRPWSLFTQVLSSFRKRDYQAHLPAGRRAPLVPYLQYAKGRGVQSTPLTQVGRVVF